MRHNPFWIIFISLIILSVLGYTTYMVVEVWQYMRLNRQTAAQNIEWSIIASSEDAFIPLARYSFIVDGKIYEGQTQWQETYLNRWTAQEAIGRLTQSPPPVWFDSSSPKISSLQKIFPFKASFYALLLWILGIYFLGLGYYVNQRFL